MLLKTLASVKRKTSALMKEKEIHKTRMHVRTSFIAHQFKQREVKLVSTRFITLQRKWKKIFRSIITTYLVSKDSLDVFEI